MTGLIESRSAAYDDPLACPIDRLPLRRKADKLVCPDEHEYPIEDGVLRLFVPEEPDAQTVQVTGVVKSFYEETPFPNYNDIDDLESLVERAKASIFAKLLSEQIPGGSNVLEVGCGTGQLSNYLAATCMARLYAADMSVASLRLGTDFAREHRIKGIQFINMNLFRAAIHPSSMDIVISNGVLHHTADPRRAFFEIANLVRPGGFVIVGLYNHIGRLVTGARRVLRGALGDWVLRFDSQLRKDLSRDKRRAWVADQYEHPHESSHSMSEVIGWFDEAGFEFVSSVPTISGSFSANDQIFRPSSPGNRLDRLMTEVEMLLRGGSEGGLFIMIGRKVPPTRDANQPLEPRPRPASDRDSRNAGVGFG